MRKYNNINSNQKTAAMKYTFGIVLTMMLASSCNCISEKNISKVICLFSPFDHADILKGPLEKPIEMSKELFKQCNIKVKIVSDTKAFENTALISFAYNGSNNKETLQSL